MARRVQRRRVPASYVLDRSETYSVQPALFDASIEGETYQISEATRNVSALGTGPGWKTMGKQYIDGKEIEEV